SSITASSTKIITSSSAAEKYTALVRTYRNRSLAGRTATFRATRATTAATRLTVDSAASERRPTEPVSAQALVFRVMVTIAAQIDSQAYRVRSMRGPAAGEPLGEAVMLSGLPVVAWGARIRMV